MHKLILGRKQRRKDPHGRTLQFHKYATDIQTPPDAVNWAAAVRRWNQS